VRDANRLRALVLAQRGRERVEGGQHLIERGDRHVGPSGGAPRLDEDPQMRQEFLNRVAGPIANKLFECNRSRSGWI
jgi:hypothetical protein